MPKRSLARNPEGQDSPFPPMPPKRYRGALFLTAFGPAPDQIEAAAVTDCWSTALMLATSESCLNIYWALPEDGKPLRKFLAGGPAPSSIPIASCRSLVGLMRETAGVSKQTALRGVRKVIEQRGGHGAECLHDLGSRFDPAWTEVANRSN